MIYYPKQTVSLIRRYADVTPRGWSNDLEKLRNVSGRGKEGKHAAGAHASPQISLGEAGQKTVAKTRDCGQELGNLSHFPVGHSLEQET